MRLFVKGSDPVNFQKYLNNLTEEEDFYRGIRKTERENILKIRLKKVNIENYLDKLKKIEDKEDSSIPKIYEDNFVKFFKKLSFYFQYLDYLPSYSPYLGALVSLKHKYEHLLSCYKKQKEQKNIKLNHNMKEISKEEEEFEKEQEGLRKEISKCEFYIKQDFRLLNDESIIPNGFIDRNKKYFIEKYGLIIIPIMNEDLNFFDLINKMQVYFNIKSFIDIDINIDIFKKNINKNLTKLYEQIKNKTNNKEISLEINKSTLAKKDNNTTLEYSIGSNLLDFSSKEKDLINKSFEIKSILKDLFNSKTFFDSCSHEINDDNNFKIKANKEINIVLNLNINNI